MNIFVLSEDPKEAAQMLCDKHVVKMVLESAQMLSTAHRMLDGIHKVVPSKSGKRVSKTYILEDQREDVLYRAVHYNHPCTQWTMKCSENYKWHYEHFIAICDEYTYRYGKVHSSDTKLREVLKNLPENIKSSNKITPFALAMSAYPECIFKDDPVKSYREYYKTKKERFNMNWKNRKVPEWFD